MTTIYTPTATYHDSATLPDDGDPDFPSAGAIMAPVEAALDNAKYLKDRLLGPQVVVPMNPCNIYGLDSAGPADRFIFSSVANLGIGWLQTDVTDQGSLTFHINPALPFKCKITSIEVRFGCLAQAGMPGTKPDIALVQSDSAAQETAVVLGTKVDPSANQGAFEQSHIVYLDCDVDLAPAADIDYDSAFDVQYFLVVRGQMGGSAAANKLMLKQVYCIIEVP